MLRSLRIVTSKHVYRRGRPIYLKRHPVALSLRSKLFSTKIEQLQRAAAAAPDNPRFLVRLLEQLNRDGRYGRAARAFEAASTVDEACARHYLYAMCSIGRLRNVSLANLRARLGVFTTTREETAYEDLGTAAQPLIIQHNNYQHPRPPFRELFFTIVAAAIVLVGFTQYEKMSAEQAFKRIMPGEANAVRFSDVIGCEEAKAELQEIVDFLKDPESFTSLGGVLPKGVLLTGSPGTGKTLLAKAVAGEANVPFLYCSGSDFEEVWVGVGARRVRELFAEAKKSDKCIIFIDELDAVGGERDPRQSNAHRQTINQLLVEMDGFASTQSIIVIGATNFPKSLDKALTRPGRFDKHVPVAVPDLRGRKLILDHYVAKITAGAIDTARLARGTPGCSGAHLENMVNEAAVHAAMLDKKQVEHEDLEWAKDKVLMGTEMRSMFIDTQTKRQMAFREGGHAVAALNTPGADPILKATIIPTGTKLSKVYQLPERDQVSVNIQQLKAKLDVHMGGRCAEELTFGKDNVTSGVAEDLESATQLARRMVLRWGMGERAPLRTIDRDVTLLSPETRERIDRDVDDILQASYKRTMALLKSRRKDLERIANALLEHETLTHADITAVLNGRPLSPITK